MALNNSVKWILVLAIIGYWVYSVFLKKPKVVIAQSGADVLNLVGGLEGHPIIPLKKR